MAAYAQLAPDGGPLPVELVQEHAARLGRPAGWTASRSELAVAVRARVLWQGRGRLALPRAYRPYARYFQVQADRLCRAAVFLLDPPPAPEPERSTYLGLVLFDFGLFFACHEHFEELWRTAAPEDRGFYHGLVQLAAAFYHHEKGNAHGARVLLSRATGRLAAYRPGYLGLDVDLLMDQLAPWDGRFARGAGGPYPVLVSARKPPQAV
jgi:hypothetical protein